MIKKLIKQSLKHFCLSKRWANFERRLQLIPQRGRFILKGPLGSSSEEEWNVQKLRVSGIPCRDGGSSDEEGFRCRHFGL